MLRLSYEGDREKAAGFLGKAQQEIGRLESRMATSGVDRGSFQLVLDDSSYCYGYILPGGIRAIHIVTTPGVAPVEELTTTAVTTMPDFLSGYSTDQKIFPAQGENPDLLFAFTPSVETAALEQDELTFAPKNAKLAVYPWVAFDSNPGLYPSSQYDVITPTMYTGTMRKLVQALMGFGRQLSETSIFDAVNEDFEVIENNAQDEVELTAYQQEVRDNGLRVRYDHRFMRSHGLVRSAENEWWVIEISMARGVIAMQLPLHAATAEPSFRDLVYESGRLEALNILDEFGGFPTGESFPLTSKLTEAYIRAGRILRLKTVTEMQPFFNLTGYSSVMGWAFNLDGSEAHNTAWTYGDDGVQIGYHYALALSIGAVTVVPTVAAAASLKELMAAVEDRADVMEAVLWKIDRLNAEQVDGFLELVGENNAQGAFDALDELDLGPMAPGTAALSKVSEGKIFWPTQGGQQQIKFPEPILGGLVSHDMRPSAIQDEYPRCDTTMHVFFAGNELKWVKYYLDSRSVFEDSWHREGDDQFDIDYTPVGNFYVANVLYPKKVPPLFYSNDFDDRVELAQSKMEWFYRRKEEGYGEPWSFSSATAYPNLVPPQGHEVTNSDTATTLYRFMWFHYDYDFYQANVETLKSGVVVPFYDREAYYYAKLRFATGRSVQYVRSFYRIMDPYCGWTSSPQTNNTIDNESYCSYAGSVPADYQKDFADHGSWAPLGADINTFTVSPTEQVAAHEGTSETTWAVAQATLITHLVNSSSFGTTKIEEESRTDDEASLWEPLWMQRSPNDDGEYQFIGETHNALGAIESIVYGLDLRNSERGHKGAYPEANVAVYPCYIGAPDG